MRGQCLRLAATNNKQPDQAHVTGLVLPRVSAGFVRDSGRNPRAD